MQLNSRLEKLEKVISNSDKGLVEAELELTYIECLQSAAECWYSIPFAENMARDSLRMNLEQYKALIAKMSEKELENYLTLTFEVYDAIINSHEPIRPNEKLTSPTNQRISELIAGEIADLHLEVMKKIGS